MLNIFYTDMNDTACDDLCVWYSEFIFEKKLRWTKDELLLQLYIFYFLMYLDQFKGP